MPDDIIKQLGYLCLGSRFKRIGERMQSDVLRFNESAGLEVQPAHCPLLAAIDRDGPMTVSALVEALGVSQPVVTRSVTRLTAIGLVAVSKKSRDGRYKTVSLTALGTEIVEFSKREVWPQLKQAVSDMCEDLSGPLLDQLDAIESALLEMPLDQRAARHLSSIEKG